MKGVEELRGSKDGTSVNKHILEIVLYAGCLPLKSVRLLQRYSPKVYSRAIHVLSELEVLEGRKSRTSRLTVYGIQRFNENTIDYLEEMVDSSLIQLYGEKKISVWEQAKGKGGVAASRKRREIRSMRDADTVCIMDHIEASYLPYEKPPFSYDLKVTKPTYYAKHELITKGYTKKNGCEEDTLHPIVVRGRESGLLYSPAAIYSVMNLAEWGMEFSIDTAKFCAYIESNVRTAGNPKDALPVESVIIVKKEELAEQILFPKTETERINADYLRYMAPVQYLLRSDLYEEQVYLQLLEMMCNPKWKYQAIRAANKLIEGVCGYTITDPATGEKKAVTQMEKNHANSLIHCDGMTEYDYAYTEEENGKITEKEIRMQEYYLVHTIPDLWKLKQFQAEAKMYGSQENLSFVVFCYPFQRNYIDRMFSEEIVNPDGSKETIKYATIVTVDFDLARKMLCPEEKEYLVKRREREEVSKARFEKKEALEDEESI